MKTVFKLIAGMVGLFAAVNGILFMFNPELVMGSSQVSAETAFGLSTVRGLIGGSMLATGALTLWAVIKERFAFLHAAAIVFIGWSFGRFVSLIADGFDPNVLFGGAVVSLLMAAALTVAHRFLTKPNRETLEVELLAQNAE